MRMRVVVVLVLLVAIFPAVFTGAAKAMVTGVLDVVQSTVDGGADVAPAPAPAPAAPATRRPTPAPTPQR